MNDQKSGPSLPEWQTACPNCGERHFDWGSVGARSPVVLKRESPQETADMMPSGGLLLHARVCRNCYNVQFFAESHLR